MKEDELSETGKEVLDACYHAAKQGVRLSRNLIGAYDRNGIFTGSHVCVLGALVLGLPVGKCKSPYDKADEMTGNPHYCLSLSMAFDGAKFRPDWDETGYRDGELIAAILEEKGLLEPKPA